MVDLYQIGRSRYQNTKRVIGHIYNLIIDRSPKILILVYHRVIPAFDLGLLNNTVSMRTFQWQICALAKRFPIISLSEAVNQCVSGSVKAKIQLVLTFDDGYYDNYEIIFPFLQKNGLPAAFFLIADYINSGGPLWDLQITNILQGDSSLKSIEIGNRIIQQGTIEPRISFILRVMDKMKPINFSGRQEIISSLRDKSKTGAEFNYTMDRCMTWEEAREISRAGMEIGSHSLSHRSLTMIPLSEAKEEIKKSKEIIEHNIKNPCRHFSFPFGGRQDYNQLLVDYVKGAGYESCLLNVHGYNHLKEESFCFKRIIMEETTNIAYLFG